MVIEILPARLADVWAFERMRPEDAAEVMASDGFSPVEAIIQSWASSKEAWTARMNGEVAAMYGVVIHPAGSALTPVGVAWLLTTVVVDRYPVAFYKKCREVVKELTERYGTLINYTDARYARAVNWAGRLGFTVHPAVPFGKSGELFHPIVYGD
jgi:hypothetical protein